VLYYTEKKTNDHRPKHFIKYRYGYMYRPIEVIIEIALENFKRNTQFALLEMRSNLYIICSHFLSV